MDPFAQTKTSASKAHSASVNPFAKALAETEHSLSSSKQSNPDNSSIFSEALARAGGSVPPAGWEQNTAPDLSKQQEDLKRQQQKEALRKKLHDQVNPVDLVDVFSTREKKVKEEIENLRKELKMLAQEIKALHHDIDVTVNQQVVNPGQDGTYYISFFQQLRTFIMLLRQKVRSARTWATQMSTKKKKRKGMGLDMNNKAKAAHDMMHHERSTQYSGG